jgi:hypothetical protein
LGGPSPVQTRLAPSARNRLPRNSVRKLG